MRGPIHVPNAAPTLHCLAGLSSSGPVVRRLLMKAVSHHPTFHTRRPRWQWGNRHMRQQATPVKLRGRYRYHSPPARSTAPLPWPVRSRNCDSYRYEGMDVTTRCTVPKHVTTVKVKHPDTKGHMSPGIPQRMAPVDISGLVLHEGEGRHQMHDYTRPRST